MGDSWINCQSCGDRYGSWLSTCPQCGSNNVGFKKKALSRGKKIGIGIGVVIGVFFVLVGIGAAASSSQSNNSANINTAAYSADLNRIVGISEFTVTKQGSMYQAHFQLVDKDLAPMTSDARVSLVVKLKNTSNGNDGQTVYSKAFDVRASDFQAYTRTLTGAQTGEMYLWLIDTQDLQGVKQSDFSFGDATLTVTLPNGKSFTADTTIIG